MINYRQRAAQIKLSVRARQKDAKPKRWRNRNRSGTRQTHRIEAVNELIVFVASTLVIATVVVVVTDIIIVAASGVNCI